MPYRGEPSSSVTHLNILKDPQVVAFLKNCSYVPNVETRQEEIRRRLTDVTSLVRPIADGIILAADGSPYEAVIEERFPSVRVGFLKFANVIIDITDYQRIRNTNNQFVDPIEMARIQRQSQSLSIAVPGAGISDAEGTSSAALLRRTIFEASRSEPFSAAGERLYDTLVDLMRRVRSVVERDGKEGILFAKDKKSPATGEPLREHLFVPLDPGFAAAPDASGQVVFVTDALRIHEAFNDEGSNLECLGRLMTAFEHLLLVHIIRCSHKIDPSISGNLHAIIDGPLAIFGEPARFHRGIMHLLDEVRRDCRRHGMPGPLVIGVSKTGKVVEHATLIDHVLQREDYGQTRRVGTWLLPIEDDYRYQLIQPAASSRLSNHGDDTYYGQSFIVRTSEGKVFDMCLAYPFPNKDTIDGVAFQQRKAVIAHYGDDIARAVSLIELMQTDLFDNALIAVHLAHKYSSIAHSPAGRSLDHFVRQVVRRRTA